MGKRIYYYVTRDDEKDLDPSEITNKTLWKGLTERTTSHGFPHIALARGPVKLTVWIILILGALVGLFYHMSYIFLEYFSYPTSVSVELETSGTLEFPSVTVCNMNIIKKMYLATSNLTTLLAAYNAGGTHNLGSNNRPAPGDDSNLETQSEQSILVTKTLEELAGLSYENKQNMGHQQKDFILECSFNGYLCDIGSFSEFYDPHLGNCYTFNTGWKPGQSWTYRSGPDYGVQLLFNVEADQYVGLLSPSVGIKVLVHNHSVMPFPYDEGVVISPGAHTQIGVKQVVIARLGGNYGNCIDSVQTHTGYNMYEDLYPVGYSQSACLKTCYQKLLVDNCNCYTAYSVPPNNVNVSPCLYDNNTQQECVDDIIIKLSDGSLSCDYCPQVCDETIYDTSMSSSSWPADDYKKYLVKTLDKSLAGKALLAKNDSMEFNKNLARLDVFYRSLNYESLVEEATYEIGPFISDFGGSLGLWIGWSVVTAAEFIEIFLDMGILGCSKKGKAKKNSANVKEHKVNPAMELEAVS